MEDELKVKNPEKKFGMAVDVRFLVLLMLYFSDFQFHTGCNSCIDAHGCGYRTRGEAIKTLRS